MSDWKPKDVALLQRKYATTPTIDLATRLKRTPRAVSGKAAQLGLAKDAAHRSEQSRRSALAAGRTSAEMAALGSLGGKIGGKARAEALTPARRRKIAKAAIAARWATAVVR